MGNLFAAVLPPPGALREAERVQAFLAQRLGGVRWVKKGLYHVTLAFYGRVPLRDALEAFERIRLPGRLDAQGLGWFDWPRGRARVIHIAYTAMGFEKLHLTLGRAPRPGVEHAVLRELEERVRLDTRVLSFMPREVFLLESTLRDGRRVYVEHARRRIPLHP